MKKTQTNTIRTTALILVLALMAATFFSCTTPADRGVSSTDAGTTAAPTPPNTEERPPQTSGQSPSPEESFVPETPGEAELAEIRSQYLRSFYNPALAIADVRVYGRIGQLYVMHIAVGQLTTVPLASEVIDNRPFLYDVQAPLYVKLGSRFMLLEQAYGQGLLSSTQLEEIYSHCRDRYSALYERYVLEKFLCPDELRNPPYHYNKIDVCLQPFAAKYSFEPEDFSEVDCIAVDRPNESSACFTVEVSADSEMSMADMIQALEERSEFYRILPHGLYDEVNETITSDVYYDFQWAIESIELSDAWDYTTGSNTILVGVIDSGIDITHPDLVGRVDLELSRSFIEGKSPFQDTRGHGTQVASVIAANTNNLEGISGVCWNVTLVSLKVDRSIFNDPDKVVEAIEYAQEIGIDILNYSGGSYSATTGAKYQTAISAFPGLFVCSAGNGITQHDSNDNPYIQSLNTDIAENRHYPSCLELPNIISVGSHDVNNVIAATSNYGANSVDLFAPGVNILTCIPTSLCDCPCFDAEGNRDPICADSGYHYTNGTSFSSPYVAGVAALILSRNPLIKPEDVREIIIEAVNPHISFTNICVSGGLLNAYNAVRHDYNYTQIDDDYHYFMCDDCTYTDGVYKFEMHDYDRYTYWSNGHALACVCGAILNSTSHSYSTEYTNEGDYHARWCICGSSLTSNHNYVYERQMNQHRRTCVCGVDVTEGHTYDYAYTRVDHYTHLAECACGKYIEEDHLFDDSDICVCGSFNR